MDLVHKIQQELDNIRITQKLNSGNILEENDIRELIKILKTKDIEVRPLLEIIESLLVNIDVEESYLLIESNIIRLLKYYNLIENTNFTTCRHKYFFSESRKLIKTKYFTEEHEVEIKQKIKKIYQKL